MHGSHQGTGKGVQLFRNQMDSNHNDIFAFFGDFDPRATGSPEHNEALATFFEYPLPNDGFRSYRMPAESNSGIRPPLPSPTNLPPASSLNSAGNRFPSVLQFNPTLLIPKFNQPNQSPGYQPVLHMSQPLKRPQLVEESNSTDATPESSDVEEDRRSRKKKKRRVRTVLTEEVSATQNQYAKEFEAFLNTMKARLFSESPDGKVQESAAISALVTEFTKVEDGQKFSLPPHCDQWLKQAAERVQDQRQMNKWSRKKKSDHGAASQVNDRFVCPVCTEPEPRVFKTLEGLNLHVRNKHEPDKQWKCFAPGCTVSFVRQADLRMHLIRMHSPQRPYPCRMPYCSKAFAGVSELRRHIKVDHRNLVGHICGSRSPAQE